LFEALAKEADQKIAVVEPAKLVSIQGSRHATVIGGGMVTINGGSVRVSDEPNGKAAAVLGQLNP
jgi:hypothetical protein